MTLSEVVEAVKEFAQDGKIEIQFVFQQYLREEHRKEIDENVIATKAEE